MRIAVLGSPTSWYLSDLRRAAGDAHEVIACTFGALCSSLGGGALSLAGADPHVELTKVDCLLVRTMAPGSLEQVVFRMDALARVEAAGVTVVNPPRAVEAAVDKYLASARLQAAGLSVPGTFVCQRAEDAMAAFERLGGDVVVKPLFGSEGRGLTRLQDEGLAYRTFKTLEQLRAVIYLQEFIPHAGHDIRVLVIGEQLLAIRRRHPTDWRTNISRGATAEPFNLDEAAAATARLAASAVGAPLAGVDLLPASDGQLHTLEVNAAPGWQALSRTLKVDVAAMVLGLLETLRERSSDSAWNAGGA